MNKKTISILMLLSFVIFGIKPVFSQEQTSRNSEGRFSFIIPNDWEEYSEETMKEISDAISLQTNRHVKYDAGLQRIGHKLPYMYLIIRKSGKLTEKQIQDVISAQVQAKAHQEAAGAIDKSQLKDIITNYKYGELVYLPARHLAVYTTQYFFNNKARISLNALFFSNYGSVQLMFFSSEEEFNSNLDDFNAIIYSFKFDKGYEY